MDGETMTAVHLWLHWESSAISISSDRKFIVEDEEEDEEEIFTLRCIACIQVCVIYIVCSRWVVTSKRRHG